MKKNKRKKDIQCLYILVAYGNTLLPIIQEINSKDDIDDFRNSVIFEYQSRQGPASNLCFALQLALSLISIGNPKTRIVITITWSDVTDTNNCRSLSFNFNFKFDS